MPVQQFIETRINVERILADVNDQCRLCWGKPAVSSEALYEPLILIPRDCFAGDYIAALLFEVGERPLDLALLAVDADDVIEADVCDRLDQLDRH